jgi:hypothetical protein
MEKIANVTTGITVREPSIGASPICPTSKVAANKNVALKTAKTLDTLCISGPKPDFFFALSATGSAFFFAAIYYTPDSTAKTPTDIINSVCSTYRTLKMKRSRACIMLLKESSKSNYVSGVDEALTIASCPSKNYG